MIEKIAPYAKYWHVKNYMRIEDKAKGLYLSYPTSLALGLINYRIAIQKALAQATEAAFLCEHYGGDGLLRLCHEPGLPANHSAASLLPHRPEGAQYPQGRQGMSQSALTALSAQARTAYNYRQGHGSAALIACCPQGVAC